MTILIRPITSQILEDLAKAAGRIAFETYDMEKEPLGQAIVKDVHDASLAMSVPHVPGDLRTSQSM